MKLRGNEGRQLVLEPFQSLIGERKIVRFRAYTQFALRGSRPCGYDERKGDGRTDHTQRVCCSSHDAMPR